MNELTPDEIRANSRARQAARRAKLRAAGLSARGIPLGERPKPAPVTPDVTPKPKPVTQPVTQTGDAELLAIIAELRADLGVAMKENARLTEAMFKPHRRPTLRAAEANLLKKAMHPNGNLSEDAAAEAWAIWNRLIIPAFDVSTAEHEGRLDALALRFKAGAAALDAKRAAQDAARRAKADAKKGQPT